MPSEPTSSDSSTLAHDKEQTPSVQPESPSALHDNDVENLQGVPSQIEKERGKNEKDSFLVDWEPNDTANPRNWSTGYKSWITFQLGMLALSASLGSSIISPAEDAIIQYTHISSEVAVLPISLFILGFAFGPMLWAPVSEVCVPRPDRTCHVTDKNTRYGVEN